MEDRNIDHSRRREVKEPPQLFTYYQGDINSVVDEHFFRALNKASIPKDLSTKTHSSRKAPKPELPTPSPWASPSPAWSKTTFSPSPSRLAQFAPAEDPVSSQGVIMSPAGLSSPLWTYPGRQGATGFELPPLLYPQPGVAEGRASSFLNLLHMDRPAGSVVMAPSKSNVSSSWDTAAGFRDSLGSSLSLDSGVQPEKSKDLYWY